jgi:hypothetical protein
MSKQDNDESALDVSAGSPLCMHRIGHYAWQPSGTDRGDDVRCRKPATHVCRRPNHPDFFLCARHAKTRSNPQPLANTH